MTCGIYAITIKATGEQYVGATTNIASRWSTHKSMLRFNRHPVVRMQEAWDAVGLLAFEFSLLEQCEKDELTQREQHYFEQLRPVLNRPHRGHRGGARVGSGPKRPDKKDRVKPVCISLEADDWAIARSVGFGNASQGIRAALRHYAAHQAGPQERKTDG